MVRAFIVAVLATAAVMCGSVQASAADLTPTGKWVVDFADRDCLMSQPFGTPAESLMLAFRKVPMDAGATLLLVYPGKDKTRRTGKAQLGFVPGEPLVEVSYEAVGLANQNVRRMSIDLTEEQLQKMVRAGRISVNSPKDVQAAFHLSKLQDVFKLGNECAIGLGEEWGFTREEQARVKTPPKGNVAAAISNDDYPSDAIRNGESGQTRARLSVGTDGKVTECAVVRSSGVESIDATTCRVARTARFKPALDADGNPVRALLVFKVTWLVQ